MVGRGLVLHQTEFTSTSIVRNYLQSYQLDQREREHEMAEPHP